MSQKMHYFSPVEGHACRRFGSEAFIGCTRGPKGFTWNTDAVVAIPESEMLPYRKDYNSYVRHGDLIRVDKAAYDKWLDKRATAGEKIKADREKAKKAAAKKAKDAADKVAKEAADKKAADKKAADKKLKEAADKKLKEAADKAAKDAVATTTNDDSGSDDADKSGTAA